MWYYKGQPVQSINDLDSSVPVIGFCYKITNLITGKIYIGKKQLHHSKRKKLTDKQRATARTRKRFATVTTESNWLHYFGSCEKLLKDVSEQGKENFRRDILALATSRKALSFLEAKFQFEMNVLCDGHYNANILGRYYTRDAPCS